jgi:tRNA(Ile)-lysidine synthase
VLSAAPDSGLSGVFDAFDLSSSPRIIVAVSGGGDSMALLALAGRYVPASRLVAVTVDHALRPESAGEARSVANFCAARSIRHVTLRWEGDKPPTGLAAAAREARYRLLQQAADDHGASIVLAGHTEDDQAETVAMRAERGDGRGLAGMAPATLLDGRIWLLRPLLGTPREVLRALLQADGVEWIDDPSNDNSDYERAATVAAERIELGHRAADAIQRHASAPSPGLGRLAPGFIREVEHPIARYALRLLLAASGGRTALPEAQRVDDVLASLAAGPMRSTLSGAVIDARRDGVFLHRERRGLPEPCPPVDGAVWDGRFRIESAEPLVPALVAPTGAMQAARLADGADGAPRSLVRAALAAEPSLWREGVWLDLLSPSTGAGLRARRIVAPFARYLTSFDLAPASAIAALVGGELPPPPPYRGHSAGEA